MTSCRARSTTTTTTTRSWSGGKADGTAVERLRSGCGAPIRTGSYALHGDVVTPTGVEARLLRRDHGREDRRDPAARADRHDRSSRPTASSSRAWSMATVTSSTTTSRSPTSASATRIAISGRTRRCIRRWSRIRRTRSTAAGLQCEARSPRRGPRAGRRHDRHPGHARHLVRAARWSATSSPPTSARTRSART